MGAVLLSFQAQASDSIDCPFSFDSEQSLTEFDREFKAALAESQAPERLVMRFRRSVVRVGFFGIARKNGGCTAAHTRGMLCAKPSSIRGVPDALEWGTSWVEWSRVPRYIPES